MFQAVEVHGEHGSGHCWDGGFKGNPALWSLFRAIRLSDLLLVQVNPLVRDELPDTASEIAERVDEVRFKASLLHGMRAIEFVQRLLDETKLDPSHHHRVFLHMITAEHELRRFGASSEYETAPKLRRQLFDRARAAARNWQDAKYECVGRARTVRIAELFP